MKDTLTEMNNNLQGINSRVDEAKNQISNLEQKEERNIQPECLFQKNEERLRDLWDSFKRSNIWIIRVPEREEGEQEIENLFEKIMKENFPNLMKEIDM